MRGIFTNSILSFLVCFLLGGSVALAINIYGTVFFSKAEKVTDVTVVDALTSSKMTNQLTENSSSLLYGQKQSDNKTPNIFGVVKYSKVVVQGVFYNKINKNHLTDNRIGIAIKSVLDKSHLLIYHDTMYSGLLNQVL